MITGKQFRGLLIAQDEKALSSLRAALRGKVGLSGACSKLGVSLTTLRRAAADWPELAETMADGAMTPEQVALSGVKAKAALRKAGT